MPDQSMENQLADINKVPLESTSIVNVCRLSRNKKTALPDYYVIYLQESDFDFGPKDDPSSFSQAMSTVWFNSVKEEIESMAKNQVWDLVELPKGSKAIDCKWVFKIKRNSYGKVEWYKARLLAKGYTKKEGINYSETFSLVSKKNSFRIIMALVAHCENDIFKWKFRRRGIYSSARRLLCSESESLGL